MALKTLQQLIDVLLQFWNQAFCIRNTGHLLHFFSGIRFILDAKYSSKDKTPLTLAQKFATKQLHLVLVTSDGRYSNKTRYRKLRVGNDGLALFQSLYII